MQKIIMHRNLPKISSPLKILPPPFLNEVVAFLLRVCPPIYVHLFIAVMVKQEAPQKAAGGTNN